MRHRYTSVGFDKARRTHVQAVSSIKAFSDPTATFQRGHDDPDFMPAPDI